CFFFSSRRRHTRFSRDWSSDVSLPIYLTGNRVAREEAGLGVGANALNTLNLRDAEDVLRRQLQAVRHNEVVPGSQVAVARVRDVLESLLQVLERQAPGRGVTRDSLVTRPHGGEDRKSTRLNSSHV